MVRNKKDLAATGRPTITEAFFYGLSFVTIVLALVSFFYRINYETHILLLLIAAYSWIKNKDVFHGLLREQAAWIFKTPLLYTFSGAIIVLLMLERSSAYMAVFDTGLYHLQTMKWIENYKVIKGLGNLHGRLAFNNFGFLLYSWSSFSFLGIFIHGLNGLLYCVLLLKAIKHIREQRYDLSFFILMGSAFSLIYTMKFISSCSNDILTMLLITYVFYIYFEHKTRETNLILILCALVAVCKVSSVFILLVPLVLFFTKELTFRNGKYGIVAAAMILVFFVIRNIILSGYLVYPFPEIDLFSMDWKIPKQFVLSEAAAIRAWAILPYADPEVVNGMRLMEWVPKWFAVQEAWNKILVILLILGIFADVFFVLTRKEYKYMRMILGVSLIAMVFWFLKAPDLRFAFGFIFTLIFMALFLVFQKIRSPLLVRLFPVAVFVLVLLSYLMYYRKNADQDLALQEKIIKPAAFQRVPVTPVVIHGKAFTVADETNGCCWYEALPCLDAYNENIYYRGEDIEDGFKQISK